MKITRDELSRMLVQSFVDAVHGVMSTAVDASHAGLLDRIRGTETRFTEELARVTRRLDDGHIRLLALEADHTDAADRPAPEDPGTERFHMAFDPRGVPAGFHPGDVGDCTRPTCMAPAVLDAEGPAPRPPQPFDVFREHEAARAADKAHVGYDHRVRITEHGLGQVPAVDHAVAACDHWSCDWRLEGPVAGVVANADRHMATADHPAAPAGTGPVLDVAP